MEPRTVKGKSLESLQSEVGVTHIRDAAAANPSIIQIPDSISLDEMVEYCREIRARTHKRIPVEPSHYIFSDTKVIGC